MRVVSLQVRWADTVQPRYVWYRLHSLMCRGTTRRQGGCARLHQHMQQLSQAASQARLEGPPARQQRCEGITERGVAARLRGSRRGRMVVLQARNKGSQQDRAGEQAQPSPRPAVEWAGRKSTLLPQATAQQPVGPKSCAELSADGHLCSRSRRSAPHFTWRRRGGRARASGWARTNGCEAHHANMHLRTQAAAQHAHWPPSHPPMLPICHSQRCPPFVDQQHEHEKVQVEEADGWSAREEAADCKEQRDAVQEVPHPLHRCDTLLGLRRARRRPRRRRRWHRLCGSQLAARGGLDQGPADCAGAGGAWGPRVKGGEFGGRAAARNADRQLPARTCKSGRAARRGQSKAEAQAREGHPAPLVSARKQGQQLL